MEIRFRRDAPKVPANDLFTFLEHLGIDVTSEVRSVQPELRRRVVTVVLASQEKCFDVVNKDNGELEFRYSNGEATPVSLCLAGLMFTPVRVHDLPFGMPHGALIEELKKYGSLAGPVEFEYWDRNGRPTKICNGTRKVRMNLSGHIPSYIQVAGFTAMIFYPGQPKTCARCSRPGHLVKDCSSDPAKKTFASAVGGSADSVYDDTIEEIIVVKGFDDVAASSASNGAVDTPCTSSVGGNTPPVGDSERLISSAPSSVAAGSETPRAGPSGETRRESLFFLDSARGGRTGSGSPELAGKQVDGSAVESLAGNPGDRVRSPGGGMKLCWIGHGAETAICKPSEDERPVVQILAGESEFSGAKIQTEEEESEGQQGEGEPSPLVEPEEGAHPTEGNLEDGEKRKESAGIFAPPPFSRAERSLSLDLNTDIGFWAATPEDSSPPCNLSWASASSTPLPGMNEEQPTLEQEPKKKKKVGTTKLLLPTKPTLQQNAAKFIRTGKQHHLPGSLKKRLRSSPEQEAAMETRKSRRNFTQQKNGK